MWRSGKRRRISFHEDLGEKSHYKLGYETNWNYIRELSGWESRIKWRKLSLYKTLFSSSLSFILLTLLPHSTRSTWIPWIADARDEGIRDEEAQGHVAGAAPLRWRLLNVSVDSWNHSRTFFSFAKIC